MGAIVFVGRHTLLEGKGPGYRGLLKEFTDALVAQGARHLLLRFYVDEAAGTVDVIQVHPDQQSFIHHMQVGMETGTFARAYEFLAPDSETDVYGELDEQLGAQIAQTKEELAASGARVEMRVHRDSAAGIERLDQITRAAAA